MLAGVNVTPFRLPVATDGTIAGVRAVKHRETPGLGDKVDLRKSQWILDFNGKSLTNPPPVQWGVRKDGGAFDQFTGATITPRAVVAAVQRALQFVQREHASLFGKPDATQKEPTA